MDGVVIVEAEEGERERRGALSFVAGNPSRFVVFTFFCRFVLLSFRRFVASVLSFCSTFVSSFCYFVSSFCCFGFVVLYQKQIREPRGALLFALKEETCGEMNRRRFLLPNILENRIILFYLPAQEMQNHLSRRHV